LHITLIEPMDGSSLRKRKLRCEDGTIISLPEDRLYRGRASVWPVPGAADLARLLDATTEQAITLGQPPRNEGYAWWWLVTKEEYAGQPGTIARTLDHLAWRSRPGWMLIDLDNPAAWAAARPLEVLQYLWPELAEASLVVRPSSGAGIEGAKGGLHIFVLVSEPQRAKEMLAELARREAYLGLPPVIDMVVGSPERLIYVAPPILLGGIAREAEATWWQEGCAIGMANICAPERPAIAPALPASGQFADPDAWPADLAQAVDGYLLSVVRGLCEDIASAQKGRRSQRLFAAGARLGNYAWTKSAALRGAGDMLLDAAAYCGYFEDYRPEIAQSHLARGWEQGCGKPEGGLPPLARWERKDEILAAGVALVQLMQNGRRA